MKRMFKAGSMFIAVLLMVCVGIYALSTEIDFNMKSNVYFNTAEGIRMSINGQIERGALVNENNRTYSESVHAEGFKSQWEIGDIEIILSGGRAYIVYSIAFTNLGPETAAITFTLPQLPSELEISGGYYGADNAQIAMGETAEFRYTVEVVDVESDVTLTACSFTVFIEQVTI